MENKLELLDKKELQEISGGSWRTPFLWIYDCAKKGWDFGNWLGDQYYKDK